ncbi:unnamed protein product [Effrenium voratum]|uniref:Uncharacterized protein n=1 Tax=Effrenium voratum TaxID=2562239 RepID=A0AA36HJC1_9DINO|nr:unnamed protein product [Effrenium voratum]
MARAALCLLPLAAADLAVCPGEGARYQDFKCNHDPTHRVCAKLLDGQGQPKDWGSKGNFWQITGQEAFQWDDQIRENHGDSWCICMWATARLIATVGCENVHLDCRATDVAYVEKSYTDGGVDLAPAKQCLQQKCPQFVGLDDASTPRLGHSAQAVSTPVLAVSGALLSAVALLLAYRARPNSAPAEL